MGLFEWSSSCPHKFCEKCAVPHINWYMRCELTPRCMMMDCESVLENSTLRDLSDGNFQCQFCRVWYPKREITMRTRRCAETGVIRCRACLRRKFDTVGFVWK